MYTDNYHVCDTGYCSMLVRKHNIMVQLLENPYKYLSQHTQCHVCTCYTILHVQLHHIQHTAGHNQTLHCTQRHLTVQSHNIPLHSTLPTAAHSHVQQHTTRNSNKQKIKLLTYTYLVHASMSLHMHNILE